MTTNTRKLKFHRHLILPAEYTQIYNLDHYKKRLDIPVIVEPAKAVLSHWGCE